MLTRDSVPLKVLDCREIKNFKIKLKFAFMTELTTLAINVQINVERQKLVTTDE